MSGGWQEDKRWSDAYLYHIKQILGMFLLSEASEEEDQLRNTDLIVLGMSNKRVACRVRKPEAFKLWPNDITIRAARNKSGNETELSKIMAGWGDYLFYGFASDKPNQLGEWRIICLNRFRAWINRCLAESGQMPGLLKSNHDDSSDFMAFDLRNCPPEIIAWSSSPIAASKAA
jgi:hypothetical protein